MARSPLVVIWLAVCCSFLYRAAAAFRVKTSKRIGVELADYSFDRFVRDFDRNYAIGSQKFHEREKVFADSVSVIRSVNARNLREKRSWTAGIHPFMDWTQAERNTLNGYKPSRRVSGRHSVAQSALQMRARFASTILGGDDAPTSGGTNVSAGPVMRNQGKCGSCWAIAAVEAVEAHLQRSGAADASTQLSAQVLLDCVQNDHHCGGTGGCHGATSELALAFMRDRGIPLEGEVPYNGHTGTCETKSQSGTWPSARRARVSGWTNLPSNTGSMQLMMALVQQGPAVVTVDASSWHYYEGGVFDECGKDAILGHAVLAIAYGQEGDQKYWHIQNSWGRMWGDHGHIKLLRHDDEDSYCGTDNQPQKGLACEGDNAPIEVCGMCGILYDPIIPEGVRIESGDATQNNGELHDGSFYGLTDDSSTPASSVSADDGVEEKVRKSLLGLS